MKTATNKLQVKQENELIKIVNEIKENLKELSTGYKRGAIVQEHFTNNRKKFNALPRHFVSARFLELL